MNLNHITRLLVILILSALNSSAQVTERIGIRYLKATDLFRILEKEAPTLAREVQQIDLKGNALMLGGDDHKIKEIREFILSIDQAPTQICLTCVINEETNDGKKRTLSRPTFYTLPGKVSAIEFGSYTIEITPDIIVPQNPVNSK